jgi:hypothetical protein
VYFFSALRALLFYSGEKPNFAHSLLFLSACLFVCVSLESQSVVGTVPLQYVNGAVDTATSSQPGKPVRETFEMKTLVGTTLVIAALVGTVIAANPHFIGSPTISDNGTTLSASGTIAGLGNAGGTASVEVIADATATTVCHNPKGNIAPGQTKTLSIDASGDFPIDSNGRVEFDLTTDEPTPGACPNGKWTGDVTEVTFSNIRILVNGQQLYP